MDTLELRAQFGRDLTPGQQTHVEGIIEEFSILVYRKYAEGQKIHGGDLWKKSIVLEELVNETLDFVVYAFTLKKQIQDSGILLGDPQLID